MPDIDPRIRAVDRLLWIPGALVGPDDPQGRPLIAFATEGMYRVQLIAIREFIRAVINAKRSAP